MQNFTPIGKATTEQSVTVHNEKSKLSIPPYTTYPALYYVWRPILRMAPYTTYGALYYVWRGKKEKRLQPRKLVV